jgi:ATP-dependent Clp protease ATP-binding subunit ClpC
MKINDFLKQSHLDNVIKIESVVSEDFRKKISKLSEGIIYSIFFIIILFFLIRNSDKFTNYKNIADIITPKIIGVLFINIGLLLFSKLMDFYFSSTYYFEKISKNNYSKDEVYTFSVGRILHAGRNTDILHGFIKSKIGKETFLRLGISQKEIDDFYNMQKIIPEEVMPSPKDEILKVEDIVDFIYNNKPGFAKFLNTRGINQKEIKETVSLVIYEIESKEYSRQWWRKEVLSKNKGLFDDWSFGKTYVLDNYSRNLMKDTEVNSEALTISNREQEIIQIENALSKNSSSNAMLVGNPGQEKMQTIWSLCRKLKKNNISKSLIRKKAILLMTSLISYSCKTKDSFEDQITRIFNETIKAGNIFLVIDDFYHLINTAKKLGSDFTKVFNPFIESSKIQIIALINTSDFHQHTEPDSTLLNSFEVIYVKPLTSEEITKIISASVIEIEKENNIFFTYQAIKEISEGSSYYFSNGVSSDKAKSLLKEIVPWAKRNNKTVISDNDILFFIEQKTNIPTSSKILADEKEKLLKLEELISKRVIGQENAIIAISNSLRRARTGIRNPNKPIGSFLFFGPTGVGKTETSKALAHVFFGDEKNMMRLDMSEYQSEDSLEKLIGSFSTGINGVFSNMLREKQYGVILLDEFEKANKNVLNLFLQIFDEGFFSDMSGQKINTRNVIFIATSNVGADTIYKLISEGKNTNDIQEEIISDIISRGLFKPELINRFDAAIIFKPLDKNDLSKIATLMLKKVSDRISEKGLTLEYEDSVRDFIISNGTNKAFGARPMNRFIQDTIESDIAKLIISGEAVSGRIIKFYIKDNNLVSEIK